MTITTQTQLRDVVGQPKQAALDKEMAELDPDAAAFVATSPFCVLATSGADGSCDASPRGGPPGFVRIASPGRLVMPDYKGNRRQDSHTNILANPQVGLVFLVPTVRETLRVNGVATLTTDPEVLDGLLTGGAPPTLALDIAITTAFVHCGKAPHRAQLWQPATWPQSDGLARARARASNGAETEGQVRERWAAILNDPKELW